MPICMLEREGRSCPVVLCDVCMEVIAEAADGNYEWFPHRNTAIPVPVSFTHKGCSQEFERQQAPMQGGEGSSSMELMCFPIYLGNNLKLDWSKAEQNARDMLDL